MKKFRLFLSSLFTLTLLLGCEKSGDETTSTGIVIASTDKTINFDANTKSTSVTFSAPDSWVITLDDVTKAVPSWLEVSPMSGDAGESTILIEIIEDATPELQEATVSINCGGVSTIIKVTLSIEEEVDEEEEDYDETTYTPFTETAYMTWATNHDITSVEDLKLLSTLVNDGTINGDGVTFTLSRNLNLAGDEDNQWIAIGTEDYNFNGTFNGNDKKISGLYINKTSDYQGLFGYVGEGGMIKNLGISGEVNGGNYVGGVVGLSKATISNCYNTCTVYGRNANVGGVVGSATATIADCYNSGSVTCPNSNVGGVIGVASGTITNCYNIGEVKSNSSKVGGIVGSASNYITNCYNSGDIVSDESSLGSFRGGIVGYYSFSSYSLSISSIANCCNTGNVIGIDYIGGIAGWIDGYCSYKHLTDRTVYYFNLINCYNAGTVSGSSCVAGIVACVDIDVYGSSYSSYVAHCSLYVRNSYNIGLLNGTSDIGGIVGSISSYRNNTSATTDILVSNSYYLDATCNSGGIGTIDDDETVTITNVNSKTSNDMNTVQFVVLLNGGGASWASDNNAINNGYPILSSIQYEW